MSPILFDNGWTDRNTDCCVNIVDEKVPKVKNLANFGPVTPEILWHVCMDGDCRKANIRTVLVKDHPLGGGSIASL